MTGLGSLRPHPMMMSKLSSPWAISDSGAMDMLRMGGMVGDVQRWMASVDMTRIQARAVKLRASGVWSMDDPWMDPTTDAHVRPSGIGVLPIRGPLFDRGWMCYQGYDQIVRAVLEMLAMRDANPAALQAIVMPISSPGGMCLGCDVLAGLLREARGMVPIFSVADWDIASAAEMIAAQATKSYTSRGALRGHVGTWTSHIDISQAMAQQGVSVRYYKRGRYKTFFASEEPRTALTDEVYDGMTGAFYDLFVEAVALGRSMEPERVRAMEARIYVGEEAIEAGLADGLKTFDDLIAELES